jgi:hypothetical protein
MQCHPLPLAIRAPQPLPTCLHPSPRCTATPPTDAPQATGQAHHSPNPTRLRSLPSQLKSLVAAATIICVLPGGQAPLRNHPPVSTSCSLGTSGLRPSTTPAPRLHSLSGSPRHVLAAMTSGPTLLPDARTSQLIDLTPPCARGDDQWPNAPLDAIPSPDYYSVVPSHLLLILPVTSPVTSLLMLLSCGCVVA